MMDTDTTGCDKDNDNAADGIATYVKMVVTIDGGDDGTTSRANSDTGSYTGPDGGEDGDGREKGQDNENVVKNATLLLFKCSRNDIKDIKKGNDIYYAEAFYFDGFSEDTGKNDNVYWESKQMYKTSLALLSNDNDNDYFYIVITNCGDKCGYYKDMPLSKVRDDIIKHAWYSNESTPGSAGETASNDDIKKFTNFVMTNEQLHSAKGINKDGSYKTDAYKGTTVQIKDDKIVVLAFEKIERLAARIDFENRDEKGTYKTYNQTAGYVYDVYEDGKTEASGDKFVLTHIRPFNCYDGGAYLLKRVGDSKGEVEYLGKETDTNGVNTNYVIDTSWRTYSNKAWQTATRNESDFNLYLGTTDQYPTAEDDWKGYEVRECAKLSPDDNDANYYILTYTNENTTPDNSLDYATGVLFKGKYFKAADWDATHNKPAEGKTGIDKVYRYYIRHSDPNDTFNSTGVHSAEQLKSADPMTFGIVRNNIYRISIESVSKIDDTPKLQLKPKIQVRKWATYTHSTLTM